MPLIYYNIINTYWFKLLLIFLNCKQCGIEQMFSLQVLEWKLMRAIYCRQMPQLILRHVFLWWFNFFILLQLIIEQFVDLQLKWWRTAEQLFWIFSYFEFNSHILFAISNYLKQNIFLIVTVTLAEKVRKQTDEMKNISFIYTYVLFDENILMKYFFKTSM